MQYSHYKLLNRKPSKFKGTNGDFVQTRNFEKPVTCKGPKLYIVKSGPKVLYVGVTSQSIRNRLRYGFQATGKNGYHGYKWKDEKDELDILIWCFPGKTPRYVESIEAETVFLIRRRTGFWPSFQTEIHFHPATKDEARSAQQICKLALTRKSSDPRRN